MRDERNRSYLRLCFTFLSTRLGPFALIFIVPFSHLPLLSLPPLDSLTLWSYPSLALGSLNPISLKKTSLLTVNNSLNINTSYLLRVCYVLGPLHIVCIISWNLTQPCKEYSPLFIDEKTRLSEVEHLAQGHRLESDRSKTQPPAHLTSKPEQLSIVLCCGQWREPFTWSSSLTPAEWMILCSPQLPPWALPTVKQNPPDYLRLLFEASSSLMTGLGLCFVLNTDTFFSLLVLKCI